MKGGFPLRPSIEALRFVKEDANIHPHVRMPPEPETKRVPNPLDNPWWVAKMVDWFAKLLFEQAALGNEKATLSLHSGGIRISKTHIPVHCEIPAELRGPFKDYLAQLRADYSPYAQDHEEYDALTIFVRCCAHVFLERIQLSWGIFPELPTDDHTVWNFAWNY